MNRSFLKRGIVLAVSALALCGMANSGRAGLIVPGTQELHRQMGLDPKFQANGWLAGFDQQDQFNIAGNFVLISPTKAIAPAHVVDGLTSPWKSLYASFSRDIYNEPPNYIQVESWVMFPGYFDDNGAGTSDDIAILNFSSPIHGITPAEIYWGELSPGMTIEFAGVGYQQEWGNPLQTFSGEFWGGTSVITDVGWPALGIEENYFVTKFLQADPTTRMALLDFYSGTGAYIDGKLVGLGAAVGGGGNDINLFIRPSSYSSFIQPVPEPSTLLLASTAVPFLIYLRWRKRFHIYA